MTSNLLDPHAGRDATNRLDAELAYLFDEWRRLDEEKLDAEDNDQSQEAEKLRQAEERTFERLIATPANTIDGIRLKLEAGARWQGLREDAAEGEWSARAIVSALNDAERLAETTDTPDPVCELAERYRHTVHAHESVKGKSDEENDRFVDDVLNPLESELAEATPTTRAGVVALLDIALDKDYPGTAADAASVLVKNARDALAGAAPGVMAPINNPIIALWAEWSGLIAGPATDDLDGEEVERAVNAAVVRIDEIELQIISAPARTLPAAFAQIDVLNHWYGEAGEPLNEPLVSARARQKEHVRAELRRLTDALAGAAPGAMVPPAEDPIFGLITACEEARTTMNAEQARFDELRAKIPAEIVNWPGVLSGMSNVIDGMVHPKFLYSEEQVREHFAEVRAAVEARTRALVEFGAEDPRHHGELLAIDATERRALAEITDHQRMVAECHESIGMPDNENERIDPLVDALNAAETAVIEGPPTTMAGFAAKVAFVGDMDRECERAFTAFARYAAALVERPVNGGAS